MLVAELREVDFSSNAAVLYDAFLSALEKLYPPADEPGSREDPRSRSA